MKDFNSYGSRRGNHEVMVRGTFANTRIRNKLVPNREGGYTRHLPDGDEMTIFDAAMKYHDEKVPLVILAGKEYGSGSSRDWAAKGPALQGVRAVIAESFERIHRSNLVGMGILPLQFMSGEDAETLGLTRRRSFRDHRARAILEQLQVGHSDDGPRQVGRRIGERDQVHAAHRHAAGSALLQARRDSAVRAAAIAVRQGRAGRGSDGIEGVGRALSPGRASTHVRQPTSATGSAGNALTIN